MKGKERFFVTLVVLFLFFSMSIGYAVYTVRGTINGSATFVHNGDIIISSAVIIDYKNLQNPANPTINGKSISFSLNFNVPRTDAALNDDYYATYQITLDNDSVFDYTFLAGDFQPSLTTLNEGDIETSFSLDGIQLGEVIPAKGSKTFNLTIHMVPNNAGNYNVSGEVEIEVEPEIEVGSLIGSIPRNSTGDLINNNMVPVTATIINSYEETKTYNIVVTNNSFELVDVNGSPLNTYSIGANTELQETVYIRIKSGARFASSTQNLNIFLAPTGGSNTSMGMITLSVPRDQNLVDTTPPTVSNVVGTMQDTRGNVLVSWTSSDNVGIDKHIIEVYKGNTLVDTKEVGPDLFSYTITGLDDGNYYFKVTVTDTSGLTANASSTARDYIWTMNVVINITQGGPNGNYTVDYNRTFTTTITANANRNLPNALTITMGGNNLNNNQYTYNNNTGALSIPNVTGNLNISGQTTAQNNVCLIEGTKVLLANNTYKNIEDINYDDLLLVWNYETGKLTKEYPIWIETEKVSKSYTNIEFSDGSSIGVVGGHAFFNQDLKEFVNVTDTEKFHVGSSIMKVENGKLKKVKVTKIQNVKKKVKYYFVASTRYWNIITNDFITTDGYTAITNLYEFDKNITWDKSRKVIKVDYKLVSDVLPYYMFKGFRAEELGVLLYKKQSTVDEFKNYVNRFITSSNMLKEPIKKNNKRYWMVTTSDDLKGKLIEEGTYYKLPKGKFYSTSENKIYEGNTKVQIWTGMHFEKVLE